MDDRAYIKELEKRCHRFVLELEDARKCADLWKADFDKATVEIDQMQTVLQDIAGQSKSDELGDDRDDADFEGAYDIMIQLARSVTTKDSL